MDEVGILSDMVRRCSSIVFFGGAGVSTESGIPDFRSEDGLCRKRWRYPPEVVLSHGFFTERTSEFFEFYRDKMIYPGVKPNEAHIALARLERNGKLKAVITQNIDGLHQSAGSKNVLELHGSIHRNFCSQCRKSFPLEFIVESEGIPKCSCGGIVKPDVVLYEESLNDDVMAKAIACIRHTDMLIVGGTSLSVYPAAGLIEYYSGNKLILINRTPTPYDGKADLAIIGDVGPVLKRLADSEEE